MPSITTLILTLETIAVVIGVGISLGRRFSEHPYQTAPENQRSAQATVIHGVAFAVIWGGTLLFMWLAVADLYVIEPGYTQQPVRGLGSDIGIALLYFGVPLTIAHFVWRSVSKLFQPKTCSAARHETQHEEPSRSGPTR